jgi:poly-gamma-glutamate capsule biosynthesis protein CapA/YwtB (metallophosphatase superfamily)
MAKTPPISRSLRPGLALLAAVGLTALCPSRAEAQYTFYTTEANYDATYAATNINLGGTVVDEAGAPVVGATLTAIAWGDATALTNDGRTATTNVSGAFSLTGMKRRSILLRVEHPLYYSEIIAVDLNRPLAETTTSAGAVVMTLKRPGRVRLLFGGDSMFGRRFVDSDGDGIEGETGDLIRPATRASDAQAIVKFVRDMVSSADYSVVNLESTTTNNPATPHPYKTFVFFSYPETLAGLTYAGVDGVSMANNHMFDYLTGGVSDSMTNVSNTGLDWCGAGTSETVAEGTTIYRSINSVPMSFLGFSELTMDGSSAYQYLLVARDSGPAGEGPKSGSLEASPTNLTSFLSAEAAARFAVPMIHGGNEYTDYPINSMRAKFVSLIGQGAGFIVAHHPHTPHGIGLVSKNGVPRFVLMSLGNFIFDQDVFETFNTYMAVVDVDTLTSGGYDVRRLQLVPFHNENYVPKMLTGEWMARSGRNIAHLSTTLPTKPSGSNTADGLTGAVVFPAGNRIVATRSATQYTITNTNQTLNLPVTSGSTGPVAFSRYTASDSPAFVQTATDAQAEYGREILLYGDFEDLDVDDAFEEGSMWSQSSVRYVEQSVVHSGTSALVMLRKSTNGSNTLLGTNNRIGIAANAKLSLVSWVKSDNGGPFAIAVAFLDSAGNVLSNTDKYTAAAGTYDWTRVVVDLTAPAGAASVKLYYKQSPPITGEGRVYLDDISLVEWEGTVTSALSGFTLPTPNNWSWLRFTPVNAGAASLGVTLTHRSFDLNPAAP